jgi:hypothetical protein
MISNRVARGTVGLLGLSVIAVFSGCGHTNELAKYPFRSATYRMDVNVAGDAAQSHTHIPAPSHNPVIEVITAVGEGIVGGELQNKIQAVNANLLATAVGDGVATVLATYADATIIHGDGAASRAEFIIESKLDKFTVSADELSSSVSVEEHLRIIHRQSAAVIWEDHETSSIPLRIDWVPGPRPVRTATAVLNVAELLSMDQEALQGILQRAASEAGGRLGETMRRDIAAIPR